MVISLTEEQAPGEGLERVLLLVFPYSWRAAAISGLLSAANHFLGWQTSLLIFPVIYWIYRSLLGFISGRLEDEKKHVEDMAGLPAYH